MKIKDLKNVLEAEELAQTAAGPELDSEKELKDEATLEKEPEELEPKVENTDVYPEDEHEQAEEVKEVVVTEEESQLAAGPELEKADELKDEATEVKEPKEDSFEKENTDVYCDACHDQAEDVKEVVVTEEESQTANGPELEKADELKDEATLEKEPEELEPKVENTDVYPEDEHEQAEEVKEPETLEEGRFADWLERRKVAENAKAEAIKKGGNNHDVRAAVKNAVANKRIEQRDSSKKELAADLREKSEKANDKAQRIQDKATKSAAKQDRANRVSDAQYAASLKKKGVDKINASRSYDRNVDSYKSFAAKSKDSENIDKKTRAKLHSEYDKPESTHKSIVSNEPVSVKESFSDYELYQILAENGYTTTEKNLAILKEGIESGKYTIAEDELTEPAELAMVDDASPEIAPVGEIANEVDELLDSPVDADVAEEDTKEVEISEGMEKLFNLINTLNEELAQTANGPELEKAEELKDEATEVKEPEELEPEVENTDVYPEDEHEQAEEVKEVVVTEEENQLANGPELEKAEELKDEATEVREPKEDSLEKENTDVYCGACHDQAEDVKEVVVTEAAPEDKSFDVDATLASDDVAEIGTNENEKDIEAHKDDESVVEPDDILKESVKYRSLKEACALDEGYFSSDSYAIETAAEKTARLTEQVSLLMAREAMDPKYDELLKTSLYAQRLQESLVEKYKNQAAKKVAIITESKK